MSCPLSPAASQRLASFLAIDYPLLVVQEIGARPNHMLHAVKQVNGAILWANTHLLFWLSLVPFATAWMGENHFAARPVALYGVVLIMAANAYFLLSRCLIHHHGKDSLLGAALGDDFKGKVSIALYASAIALSFANRWLGFTLYWVVALIWLIPDRRIERVISE